MGRTMIGVACLGAVLVAGCGSEHAPTEDVSTEVTAGAESPVRTEDGEILVQCDDRPSFPVSAMDDGVSARGVRDGIADALDDLNTTAGMDAPLHGVAAAEADWQLLTESPAEDPTSALVGVGPWSTDRGPGRGALYVFLERERDEWRASGWGHCNLEPSLVDDAASWATVLRTSSGRDPASTTVKVRVTERECASSRDPTPYLHDPFVVETETTVTVYWTSEAPIGNQACPSNPVVERTVHLDDPLGERTLLDGSTWPPSPI